MKLSATRLSTKFGYVLCLLAFCPAANAQIAGADKAGDHLQAVKEDTQWFRDAKFGIMVHVGPVNLTEKEISWSRGGPRAGFKHGLKPGGKYVPVEVYDNLYKQYNPAKFDANQWVQTTKDAGAKYFVFTTKHHDGF